MMVSDTSRAFLLDTLSNEMNLGITDADIEPDVPIGSTGLDLGSLDIVELTMQAERAFGVKIPDEDIDRIAGGTVGDLIGYLDERRANRSA